jgi:uncharacterized protein (DUF58 family)
MPLFDSKFLAKLEYLSLVSKRVFRGSLLAQRRTTQLGSGVEFSDHREYTLGDDFRYIDWNLFARLDELLLKRFREEEDLHVYFLLDCSRSMAFGERPKFDFARQVTAALAYIALADLDRVAIVAFAADIVADLPLTRGKGRILALLKFLENLRPTGDDTDLGRVAAGFVHREQRRGLAVVVSDLYDRDGFERGLDLLRHRKYEPHLVQIYDPLERDPSDMLGDLEMIDVETQTARKVTVTERKLRQYRQLFDDFQDEIQSYCDRYGLGCTRTSTEIPFDQLVLKMMRQAGAVH